ncbi:MBL fold metallo-hydrolase [Psychrobacter jeotgali]|uniref:MBL fold metallo-hydrolase n=1 Tax=Psychrobacter jeotgali TaxID=179010 RepID=UPI0019182A80|nr:MBL fold metallo-hydrolase [Psychrobacter jeotgali]
MLQLTFLGTSAGVPTKARNVTALAIECLNPYLTGSKQHSKKNRPWLLIDCGEGTQQQLLHTKLSLNQLTAIFITHIHGDHCYGLPGLLASAAMSGRREAITIIAPKAIEKFLDAVKLTTQLYFPFAVHFIAIEELLNREQLQDADTNTTQDKENRKFTIPLSAQQRLDIDIHPLSHRVPSYGFGLTQIISRRTLNTDKLQADGITAGPLWGKLQQGEDVRSDDGQLLRSADYVQQQQLRTRIVVAGDNDTPNCLTAAVKDTDLLIHEATYTTEVLAKILAKNSDLDTAFNSGFDPMHSSARQVGSFAQKSGLQNLILTHFSARYQSFDNPESSTANMGHIRIDAQSVYHSNLWLAADFDQYLVNGATDNSVQYLGSARKPD